MEFNVIAAHSNGFIGNQGHLPWKRIKEDIEYFQSKTKDAALVLGRKTYDEIKHLPWNFFVVGNGRSFSETLALAQQSGKPVWVIGGEAVYVEALTHENLGEVHLTEVFGDYTGDARFPLDLLDSRFKIISERLVLPLRFRVYRKSDEYQYLDLIEKILSRGSLKAGTISLFGNTLRFDLRSDVLPVITTKKVFVRGVIEELLWFLRGSTSERELSEKGVHIWSHNSTRSFLDSRGLDYPVGELGPIYGAQWRGLGSCKVDQVQYVISELRSNPNSRRAIISAWNPTDIPKMALPPCHVLSQFLVGHDGLTCILYQRSCDVGLGLPFNIASYSILTRMIASVLGLKCKELIMNLGDTHIYLEHIDGLREQVRREPMKFCHLRLRDRDNIDDFEIGDFLIDGYKSHERIDLKFVC